MTQKEPTLPDEPSPFERPYHGKKRLTMRQQRFVEEYVKDWSVVNAALRAGYSEGTAKNSAYRIMNAPGVREAIASHARDVSQSAGLTAEDVIGKTALLLEKSMREHPDGKGNMRMEAPQVAAKCLDVLYRYHGLYEADNEQKSDPFTQVLESIGGSMLDGARKRTQVIEGEKLN